jgi:hypothetical protein
MKVIVVHKTASPTVHSYHCSFNDNANTEEKGKFAQVITVNNPYPEVGT